MTVVTVILILPPLSKIPSQLGKKVLYMAVNFMIRAVIGMALIFFINQYVIPPESSINVGLNAVSFLTSGMLGIPGVGLLYGIVCYQIL